MTAASALMRRLPMTNGVTMILVSGVIFVSTTIAATTGFGNTIVGAPICALIVDIKIAVPLLATTSAIISWYLAISERRYVDWKEWKRMLIWCGVGFPLGNYLYHVMNVNSLRLALGVFVAGVAVVGLYRLYAHKIPHKYGPVAGRLFLIAGGITHGALASGGPLIVAYTARAIPTKREFRATMYWNWIVFNTIFIISYFSRPGWSPWVPKLVLAGLPATAGGIWLGSIIHARVSEPAFRKGVLVLLLIVGLLQIAK